MPIALLLDLYDRDGPSSREIYRHESVADDVAREEVVLAEREAEAVTDAGAGEAIDFTA